MRPVWSFTLERITDAPLELVASRLKNGSGFQDWHRRHCSGVLRVVHEDSSRVEIQHESRPIWGVLEQDRYVVLRQGERLLLTYEARFKGWPVLVLMSWWRIISDRLWERFVEHLPGGEA